MRSRVRRLSVACCSTLILVEVLAKASLSAHVASAGTEVEIRILKNYFQLAETTNLLAPVITGFSLIEYAVIMQCFLFACRSVKNSAARPWTAMTACKAVSRSVDFVVASQ